MRFLKTFVKVFIPFTIFMLIGNYIFIKISVVNMVSMSLIISILTAIDVYRKEKKL